MSALTCDYCAELATLCPVETSPYSVSPDVLCKPCARSQTDGPVREAFKPIPTYAMAARVELAVRCPVTRIAY